MSKNYATAILWVVAFQVVGFVSGLTGYSGKSAWYLLLNKSSLTPPGYIFSIVWPLLYLFLAVVGWMLWSERKSDTMSVKIFGLQMILNWLWTPVFFRYHLTGVALVMTVAMIVLTGWLINRMYPRRRVISSLLLPYVGWLCFACYLNAYICWYN